MKLLNMELVCQVSGGEVTPPEKPRDPDYGNEGKDRGELARDRNPDAEMNAGALDAGMGMGRGRR